MLDNYFFTKDLIKKHEGCVLTPYKDTKGILTIGYGYNLAQGISLQAAEYLLDEQIAVAKKDCKVIFINFENLTRNRRAVLINMAYNMGRARLIGFKKMIVALVNNDFDTAAVEMLDSKWHREDVGERAVELADLMRKG